MVSFGHFSELLVAGGAVESSDPKNLPFFRNHTKSIVRSEFCAVAKLFNH